MIEETRKILGRPDLRVTATCVRVPVRMGHAVSINVELEKEPNLEELKSVFRNSKGVVLLDDVSKNEYPMAIIANDKDEVYVGRIRHDYSLKNGLNLWVVADNIRKGAASNAVQILEKII